MPGNFGVKMSATAIPQVLSLSLDYKADCGAKEYFALVTLIAPARCTSCARRRAAAPSAGSAQTDADASSN